MIAILELGTNTFKYVVGTGQKVLLDRVIALRLGAQLQSTGSIGKQNGELAIVQIKEALKSIKAYHPKQIICVGAMTLRSASDARFFVKQLENETGLQLRTLSGEEEARLAWKAATLDCMDSQSKAILDVGGGSVEFIFGKQEIERSFSLPLGAVILTDRFIHEDPPQAQELEALQKHVRLVLDENIKGLHSSKLIAIGGSATNLASLNGSKPNISGFELQEKLALLSSLPLKERRQLAGLEPQRADIIIAGALVIQEALSFLLLDALQVSYLGVRHALLAELSNQLQA